MKIDGKMQTNKKNTINTLLLRKKHSETFYASNSIIKRCISLFFSVQQTVKLLRLCQIQMTICLRNKIMFIRTWSLSNAFR